MEGIVLLLVHSTIVSYNILISHVIYSSITTNLYMHAVTCPQAQSAFDDSVRVSRYRNPAMEGTTITFSCPDGLILIGANTSTCTGNGEWDPELKETNCKGELIISYFVHMQESY